LTMFVGATGPFAAAMLSTARLRRLPLVATHAACMTAQHGLKIVVFGVLGFAYGEWAWLIAGILFAGVAGSAVGTQALRAMSEARFTQGFKFILSAVALYLLAVAAVDVRTD